MKNKFIVEIDHVHDGPFDSLEDMHHHALEKLDKTLTFEEVSNLSHDPAIYFNIEVGYETSTITFDLEVL